METGNTKLNLDTLGWPTLEERRLQTKLITFQKSKLNLIDIPTDHLKLKSRQTRQNENGLTYHREFSKINSHLYSFYPHTTLLWNHLPPDTKNLTNIDDFSDKIKSLNLTAIKYAMSTYLKILLSYRH